MYNLNKYKVTFKVDSLGNDDEQLKTLQMFRSEINMISYIDSFNIYISFLIKTLDELCNIMKIAQKYQCVMIDCEFM